MTTTILYIYMVLAAKSSGIDVRGWVYSGEYANPAACQKAAEMLNVENPLNVRCIDKNTGKLK